MAVFVAVAADGVAVDVAANVEVNVGVGASVFVGAAVDVNVEVGVTGVLVDVGAFVLVAVGGATVVAAGVAVGVGEGTVAVGTAVLVGTGVFVGTGVGCCRFTLMRVSAECPCLSNTTIRIAAGPSCTLDVSQIASGAGFLNGIGFDPAMFPQPSGSWLKPYSTMK